MDFLFGSDSIVRSALEKTADVLLLTVLYIALCIPVITFGAATTAYFTILLKMVENKEPGIVKPFFSAFKENIKKPTLVWIIMAPLGAVFAGVLYAIMKNADLFDGVEFILPIYVIVLVLYLFTLNMVFPYIAQFEDTVSRSIYVSFIFSIKYLLISIVLVATDAALIFIGIKITALAIFFMPAISGYMHASLLKYAFNKEININKE